MEKHYKENWLSPLYRGLVLSVALLFASTMAMAQLSGTYTINADSSTSGRNFASFGDFTTALSKSGISGAVTVNVVAKSGPYSERVELPAISTNATNTITINGNGETLVNTASSSTIEFNGADYYTIDNLKIEAQGTGTGTRVVHLWNGANYNTIKNCELIVSKYTGTSNSTGYIVLSGSKTGNSAALHGSHNTFSKNKMWNGGASSTVGPYYGVCEYGSSSYYTTTGNNQVLNNDISNVYYYTMYFYYCNGYRIDGNKIHHNRSDANYQYITYLYYGRTTTHPLSVSNNEIYSISLSSGYMYLYTYQCYGTSAMPFTIDDNKIHDNSVGYYLYNYLGYYAQYVSFQRNKMYNNYAGYYLYNLYMCYYSQNPIIKDNEIYDNSAGYYVYGLGAYYATNAIVEGNSVHDNDAGYGVYGMYIYYMSGEVTNNLYYNNTGDYYNYAVMAGYTQSNLNVCHNTFIMEDDVTYYNYGLYMYMYYTFSDVNVKNNIIYITADAGYYNYVVYMPYNYANMNIENNDFYVNNSSVNYYYTSGQLTSMTAFASSIGNTTNINVDPKFINIAKGNLEPTNPEIANYGQPGYAKEDFANKTRTACGPDLGAFEFTIDHSASNFTFSGTNECGGYQEKVTFDFTNGVAVGMSNVRVYYTINGGTPVIEEIPTVGSKATVTYTFKQIAEFHEPGKNVIEVGLLCDDNTTNNTIQKTINITPAPYGFATAEGSTFPGYFKAGGSGGSMTNPDVTATDLEINYDVVNPSRYPNSTYGTDWTLTPTLFTAGGMAVTSGFTYTQPSGGAAVIAFKPASTLVDSLVFVGFTVKDNNTRCDSLFGRWVYIPATPNIDWTGDDGCDGDVIAFINKTKQAKGLVEYMWDFGDPGSGAENNASTISDPVHRFSTYGSFDVKVSAWNFAYPKFVYTLTKKVNISPVPTVCFKVTNACEGDLIKFTNCTTSPVSGTIDYKWSFGDGTANSTAKDPSHKYNKAGGYSVTLNASLKGCNSALTKNANQFARPKADFAVSGKCNLEDIKFTNGTTIALGNSGYRWDFGDKAISNLSNPTHAFATPGSHTVKLTAISEFGCEHEVSKVFTLNESPKADFTFTDACNLKAVEFTRTGSLPTGNSIYQWDFDGENVSTKENPSHLFNTVGVKKVSLMVSSDNGCSDMTTKEFVVKLQAKADFIATDVCEGDEVVFTNKSTVASGNLNYTWRYGDGNNSNITSPRHAYTLQNSGETESFNVTLVAIVPGGCSDSIARSVTVNAKSSPAFTAKTKWRNLIIENQKTKDPLNIYNWRFGDGGRSGDVTPTYEYTNIDYGVFEVCLSIINNAGCESEECHEVTVDMKSSGISDIATNGFSVYPNPNRGMFNVKVNNAQSDLQIVVLDAMGRTIRTINTTDASGVYGVDLTDVAAGVYLVQVTNGNTTAIERVTISK